MDRHRPSHDGELAPASRSENPNVFDDEYEADTPTSSDFHIADGFRTGAIGPDTRVQTAAKGLSNTANPPTEAIIPPTNSRSSIYKPRTADTAFAMNHERSESPVWGLEDAVATPLAGLPQRISSASSSYAPTERAQSPAARPAYPYGLYQQSTDAGRSPSIATTSTRPPTVTSLPQRPTHPYALYQQNVALEDGESSTPVQSSVPVGFPGRGTDFHRQIGPDGEEQDIIGPDGHTEQLPPYSRYPEEGAAKVAVVTGASQDSLTQDASTSSQQAAPSATASSVTMVQQPESGESGNVSDKSWNEKTWKEKRRTKFCGGRMPCWVMVFMVTFVVVVAGLVAGLVGGMISAEKNSHKGGHTVVTTTLYDASAIAAPTNIPGPKQGEWALPLGVPEEQQTGCLTDNSQASAWTCSSSGPPLLLNITAGASGQYVGTAQLGDVNPQSNIFNYGTQPPQMQMSPLEWVLDLDDQHSGPALHFQAYYDKVVIVSDSDFGGGSSNRRLARALGLRAAAPSGGSSLTGGFPPPPPGSPDDGSDGPGGGWHRRGRVMTGDQPWLCYWNQTFIEGFIYMQENSTDAASQSSAFASFTSNAPPPPPPFATPPPSSPSITGPPTTVGGPPWEGQTFSPPVGVSGSALSSYFSSMYFSSLSAAAQNNAASDAARLARRASDNASPLAVSSSSFRPSQSSSPTSTSPTMATSPPSVYTVVATGSGTISATSYTVPTFLPLFPHIIKVEESRMSQSDNKAYCKKMQLLNGDQLLPLPGPDDGAIIVNLSENDPSPKEIENAHQQNNGDKDKNKRRRRYRRMWDHSEVEYEIDLRRRDEPPDSCHCQWRNS